MGGSATPHYPPIWGVALDFSSWVNFGRTPQFGGYSLFFPALATTPDYPPFWGVVPQIMRFHNYTTKSFKNRMYIRITLWGQPQAAVCFVFCGVGAPFTTFLLCFESCFWLNSWMSEAHNHSGCPRSQPAYGWPFVAVLRSVAEEACS